ncbi:hypothetical protein CMO90_03560 [Candidatus Woesearchaeota archaeon]|nr:hypothetical protein [Candidatus Woesearchaeota archaeon]
MMLLTVTDNLLDVDFYHDEFKGFNAPNRGFKYKRIGWVEDYIKFYAQEFSEGVEIDRMIDWVDSAHTYGNNFFDEHSFYKAMHIAKIDYGIKVPYVPLLKFKDLSFSQINNVISDYDSGLTAKKVVRKYDLFNDNVVYHLRRDVSRKLKRFGVSLEKVLQSKKF